MQRRFDDFFQAESFCSDNKNGAYCTVTNSVFIKAANLSWKIKHLLWILSIKPKYCIIKKI